MTEPTVTTPVQQAAGSDAGTVATPAQQVVTPSTPQEDYKPRYDGALLKMQEQALTIKGLQDQLAEKTSLSEQLQGQLLGKDAEFDAVKGQHESALQELQNTNQATQAQLDELKALQMKVEVAQELGHPELMTLFANIPNGQDKEAIKTVMESVINFSNGQVKAREEVLTAGVTPAQGTTTLTAPTTEAEWMKKINSLPEHSPEKAEAWDAYFVWSQSQK